MAKNKKPVNCIAVNLILCGKPLKNVLGFIGRKKLTIGAEITKKLAITELLSVETFTDDEIKEGEGLAFKRSTKK